MKTICDIAFSTIVLIVIAYGYLISKQLTMGEFLIAIMINYVGTRYLLMSDLDLRLTELEIEAALKQQELEDEQ